MWSYGGSEVAKDGKTLTYNSKEVREALKNADLKKGVRLYVTNADGSRFVLVKTK